MKRLIALMSVLFVWVLSGCTVIDLLLPPVLTLIPTVSSPFPPGRVETMAAATLTAIAPTVNPPTANIRSTATNVPIASAATLLPAESATSAPNKVPSPTPNGKPYAVQAVGPLYTANFANPAKGCAWQGVAGQVLRTSGEAVTGLVVVVTGQLNGNKVDLVGMTGNQKAYGPGGYEIVLGNNPTTSTKTLFIQLFDTEGKPLTEPYVFDTFSTCNKALAIINFQEVR